MTANPFEGGIPFTLGEREVVLRVDWRASGALIQAVGPDWGKQVITAFSNIERDPAHLETIAKVVVILSRDEGLTTQDVYDASPPVGELSDAFLAAYHLFYQGHPGLVEDDEEEAAAKSDSPLAMRTSWSIFGERLLQRVWSRQSSGASPARKRSNGSAAGMSASANS